MTIHDPGDWLEAVLVGAKDARWCMRPYCTTCGCLKFRQAFWDGAARQAGMTTLFKSVRHPMDILEEVSAAEREVLVRTLVAGLRELSPMWSNSEAFRTIIIDLGHPLILHGVLMDLDTELSATPAGDALACMRARAERSRVRLARQEEFESPQAVEERKRVKREKMAIEQARRQSEKRRRDAERLDLLAALARLSPADRLSRFATDPTLRLAYVSAELIPTQERDLIELEKTKAIALLARIDRRKGAWGRLRRMLEHLARDEPESRMSQADK